MRKMDTIGIKLCDEQAELFEKSLDYLQCSSPVFIRHFAYSMAADLFDGLGEMNVIFSPEEIYEEIREKYADKQGNNRYDRNTLSWMGYLYRYWCYVYETNLVSVLKIIRPEELKMLYFPYHSLDPEQAVQRILEAKNFLPEDEIRRGVRIYREILKERNIYVPKY